MEPDIGMDPDDFMKALIDHKLRQQHIAYIHNVTMPDTPLTTCGLPEYVECSHKYILDKDQGVMRLFIEAGYIVHNQTLTYGQSMVVLTPDNLAVARFQNGKVHLYRCTEIVYLEACGLSLHLFIRDRNG